MIAKSTAIVRGKVVSSWAGFSGPVIYTHYTMQVSEQLKGDPDQLGGGGDAGRRGEGCGSLSRALRF